MGNFCGRQGQNRLKQYSILMSSPMKKKNQKCSLVLPKWVTGDLNENGFGEVLRVEAKSDWTED